MYTIFNIVVMDFDNIWYGLNEGSLLQLIMNNKLIFFIIRNPTCI